MTNPAGWASRRRFLGNVGVAGAASGLAGAAVRADAAPKTAQPFAQDYFDAVLNPSFVDARIDSRAVSFENPMGERGVGCLSVVLDGARKSRAGRKIAPGERVILANLEGPGTLRHIWMALNWERPELMRSLRLEAFYGGGLPVYSASQQCRRPVKLQGGGSTFCWMSQSDSHPRLREQ